MGVINNGEFELPKPIYVCYVACFDKNVDSHKPYMFYIKKIRGMHLYENGEYQFISVLIPYSMEAVRSILSSGEKIHGIAYVQSKDIIRVLGQVKLFDVPQTLVYNSQSLKKFLEYTERINKESDLKLVLGKLNRSARRAVRAALNGESK